MFDDKCRKMLFGSSEGKLKLFFLSVLLFCTTGYGLAAKPLEPPVSELKPTIAAEPAANVSGTSIVDNVCGLLASGEFSEAGAVIDAAKEYYDRNLDGLLRIVREYEAIQQHREVEHDQAYQDRLADLDKYRTGVEDNDVNDVNNIAKMLSAISKVAEFADEQQREDLLADPFVTGVFDSAKRQAAEYEAQGLWLDSYMICYSWLKAIMPENNEYSEHADRLIDKANIEGSFRDSPCETQEQRYEKIEPRMFKRAIEALHFNYVTILDYRQMADKAIERCILLTDVVDLSGEVRAALWEQDPKAGDGLEDYEQKLAAWSSALAAIAGDVDESVIGLGKEKFIDIFDKVLAVNSSTIELPLRVLIAQFSEASLSVLDPYTVMIWPRQVQEFEKSMTNEFTGIGIEISKQNGFLTISSLLPDTPAYTSGLDAGDIIEEVDDVPTKDMSLTCAVRSITGPAGTRVVLTIRRNGADKTMEIPIVRDRITVPTIRGWQRTEGGKWLYWIDDTNKVGYLRLTSFSSSTAADFDKVLMQLEGQGMAGLILDLRFNSGGLLDSAVNIVDKFIDEGLIVRTQPRYIPTYQNAHKEKTHPDYPLVVLTNRYSASASEIVAGALADITYKRAVIVGERTHGKGSVQGITPYPGEGAQLKYTMAYYHLPSDQRVESQEAMKKAGRDDWGVGPNVKVRLRSDEMKRMIDVQRDNDVLVQANMAGHHKSLKKRSLQETLDSDPQLATGLLILKSKLIQRQARRTELEIAQVQNKTY